MCLSSNGELLASASVRGSVIRVFDASSGKCLSVIRRGRMHADIVNIELCMDWAVSVDSIDTRSI